MRTFCPNLRVWSACVLTLALTTNQLSAALPSATGAARFLEQASWGASPAALTDIQTHGFPYYLAVQYAAPISPLPPAPIDQPGIDALPAALNSAFFTNAVNGQDQLRQRVAFALSQIWVVSLGKENTQGVLEWYRLLQADAFSNYLTIMHDVTLNPAMGHYLDMVNNRKANPKTGSEPNENYAREIMQLFTIGLSQLNPDGTQQKDSSGNPIPTYTQKDVQELARVFTGWTYATAPVGQPSPQWTSPMVANNTNHDTGSKVLLGSNIPSGGTPAIDLDAALNILFNHPSLPPFVCKQLIQHLVTSNPSPAYVQRVSAIFVSNAAGVRGDMKSVIKAILTDPEARAGDTTAANADFGHLKEPVVFVTALLRALNAQVTNATTFQQRAANMGQNFFASPSVFNYFSPDYGIGPNLVGPEFQIHYGPTEFERDNFVNDLIYGGLASSVTLDLSPWQTLASDPNKLADAISTTFLRGQMSSTLRSNLLTAVAAQGTALQKAQAALYLAATSEEYQVSY